MIPSFSEIVVNMNFINFKSYIDMSSPQTQEQVCNQINAYLAKEIDATKLFKSEITDSPSKLYDPNISGPRFFYYKISVVCQSQRQLR
jgi:hypothetical protein